MSDNSHHIPIHSWDEESFPVAIQDFDWESVFASDEGGSKIPEKAKAILSRFAAKERETGRQEGLELLIKLLQWADGSSTGGFGGMAIRMVALQFLFNPDYADETQAAILRRYGINKKQLLNRELSHYRDKFGQQDPRFYSQAARIAYAQRFREGDAIGDGAEVGEDRPRTEG